METKLWTEDANEMRKLQDRINAFVVDLVLDGVIPMAIVDEGISPLGIGEVVKAAILAEILKTNK